MKTSTSAPNVVVLTGPMGAGKSAVGAHIARKLRSDFIDTDHAIEAQSGMKIAEIFATQGESAFRALEETICTDLIRTAQPGTVIALGGGAFMTPGIREAASQPGVLSVYLHTHPESSWERIRHATAGAAKRPLLAHPQPLQKLQELYDLRHPVYSLAKLTVTTDDLHTNQVVHAILHALQDSPAAP